MKEVGKTNSSKTLIIVLLLIGQLPALAQKAFAFPESFDLICFLTLFLIEAALTGFYILFNIISLLSSKLKVYLDRVISHIERIMAFNMVLILSLFVSLFFVTEKLQEPKINSEEVIKAIQTLNLRESGCSQRLKQAKLHLKNATFEETGSTCLITYTENFAMTLYGFEFAVNVGKNGTEVTYREWRD